jgi:hypothetical protein
MILKGQCLEDTYFAEILTQANERDSITRFLM